jgi:UDP-glucose 4-epimerase
MRILVTGGAGFIGSHTALELLRAGHEVVVVDNMSNAKPEALRRVQKLAGRTLRFDQIDLLDRPGLDRVFRETRPEAVIHFAGLKSVGESVRFPRKYYENNFIGSMVLTDVMEQHQVKTLVFSSSATVYGDPRTVPITEDFPLSAVNPYGTTKLEIEWLLRDLHAADPTWRIALLRYFNPVGADESGLIGEDPTGVPNNLLPYITQVAVGRLKELSVYGNDYPTIDGTGVRDYIHVVDLALGHLKALEKLSNVTGCMPWNLGTGVGLSVLQLVTAFEKASGQKVAYRIAPRRPGDAASCYADASLAKKELGWVAQRGVEEICRDAWRWQSQNPTGYPEG